MNGNKYLLDTCFVLGLYNSNSEALQRMIGVSLNDCTVSVISEMELLGYAPLSEHDEQEMINFLNRVHIFALNHRVKNKTIELRKRHKIKLPDAIVLATELTYKLELLSLDTGLINKYQKEISYLI